MWFRSLLCVAGLIFMTTAAMAQPVAIQRGGLMIAGSASIVSQGGDLYESDGDGTTTIALMPKVGFFAQDGLMLGGFASYTRVSQGDGSMYVLGLGPTVAYFMSSNSDAVPFVGGGVKMLTVGASYDRESDSETGYGFFLYGGVVFLVGSHLGITAEVSYNYDRFKPEGWDEAVTGNTIAVAFGLAGFLQ